MYKGNGHAPDKFIINEETMCILHNKSNWEALTENWGKGIYKPFDNKFKTYLFNISCGVSNLRTQNQVDFWKYFLCFLNEIMASHKKFYYLYNNIKSINIFSNPNIFIRCHKWKKIFACSGFQDVRNISFDKQRVNLRNPCYFLKKKKSC